MNSSILILHGWGSCARNWGRVKELLESRGYKVFIPDLPGFGENPPPERPWSVDDYVNWVGQHIENLSQNRGELQEPFFLLGHSFGGGMAVKFANAFPEKVSKLILVAPAIWRRRTFRKEALKKLSRLFKKLYFLPFYSLTRRIFYKIIVRKSDYLAATGVMKETYLKIISENLSGRLSAISVPTLIIWGERDDILSVEDAYFMNQEIKNSDLAIIPDANHDLERKTPEILVEKIIQFIH